VGPIHIDLPETRHGSSGFALAKKGPTLIERDFRFERYLRAGKQADGDGRFIRGRKSNRAADELG